MAGYSKEQQLFHSPREPKEKKIQRPIAKISEKKKAEMENRKTWTAEQLLQAQKEIKKEKKLQYEKTKTTPVSLIKADLDVIYSLVVRMEPADADGMVKCFCCSNRFEHWSKIQNGHFLKRSTHPSLIFCRKNTHPQSKHCNIFLNGNELPYLQQMKKVYGETILEELQVLGLQKSGNGAFEYQIMLQDYIEKFLVQCTRLNHTPTKIQQKIVDKWKAKL